jgi:hypothetical protein
MLPAGEQSRHRTLESAHAVDCAAFSSANKGQAIKIARRRFLSLAAGAVAFPSIGRAQTYPARPVRHLDGVYALR